MSKRPVAVTIIGFAYILTGAVDAAYPLIGLKAQRPFQYDILWIELIGVIAILSGLYLLRGQNWARWLAIAWIAFHVILSVFHTLPELAIHSLFCAILAYFLFRSAASRYFRSARS